VLHEQSHRFPSLWEIYAHVYTFFHILEHPIWIYVYIYIYAHIQLLTNTHTYMYNIYIYITVYRIK
jgi:hypothetical protein